MTNLEKFQAAAAFACHRAAMAQCDLADELNREAKRCLERALEIEIYMAEGVIDADPSANISRGIYYRSAGSIALQCGEKKKAKELLTQGLKHNPPPEIADQIWELLKECE